MNKFYETKLIKKSLVRQLEVTNKFYFYFVILKLNN
jgi:hypothetical protein